MRVFTTGFGAILVHHAVVIGHQKWTGGIVKNIILIFVQMKVLLNQLCRFYFQMAGQPFDILIGYNWAYRATAVGTGQAVEFGKYPIVQFVYHLIQITGRFLF